MGADGLAEGELREGEAMGPVIALAGEERIRLGISTGGEPATEPTAEEWAADKAVMVRGLEYAARHGITSFHNMDGNLYQLRLLEDIERDGGLLCRAQIPFHFKNFMGVEALDRASEMAKRYNSDWLSSGMVKIFMDGVLDSWTAVMVEPYADRPDWRGEPLFSDEFFAQVATEADRRGLQIAVHAIGDQAVRSVLDGYEAAQKANGRRDSRHRIEHIEVTTEEDLPRFAELGVIASMQPPHPPGQMGLPLEPTVSRIGRARWPLAYAWRTIKNTGAHVVFASDWPVSPIDPIAGIHAAVTRKKWADDLPDQSFGLHEAIAGYTVEGAYAQFREDRQGRLKPGYFADLVVLSDDIEAVAPEALDRGASSDHDMRRQDNLSGVVVIEPSPCGDGNNTRGIESAFSNTLPFHVACAHLWQRAGTTRGEHTGKSFCQAQTRSAFVTSARFSAPGPTRSGHSTMCRCRSTKTSSSRCSGPRAAGRRRC